MIQTEYIPLAAGGISMDEVNMDSAIAAHEALKRGEDPFKAVDPWVNKGKKGARVVEQEDEKAPAVSYREYFTAIANLARGDFEKLSLRDLILISAVTTVP